MRNVVITVTMEDEETETKFEEIYTLKQIDILSNHGLNAIEEIIPQLNKKLTEELGYHEDILRFKK